MTIEEAKNKLVAYCNSQVGTKEGANNWNKYAADPDIVKMYGWNPQNQPWCDVFCDVAYKTCFGLENAAKMTYQQIGRFSALCSASANYFKSNSAWYTKPEVGDQAFFYSSGAINHMGIVTAVSGTTFTTVEGNYSDMVARRTYTIGSSAVAGFGRPKWSVVAGEESPVTDSTAKDANVPTTTASVQATPTKATVVTAKSSQQYHSYTYSVKINLLKKGDYGPQVKNMQYLLKANGYDCPTSGEFDSDTWNAVYKFQKDAGLAADGDFGGKSFTALWNLN